MTTTMVRSNVARQRLEAGETVLGLGVQQVAGAMVAGLARRCGFDFLFTFLFISALVVAGALFLVAPKIRRMMAANDHAQGPADKSEKAEPEPLPTARVHKDE